MEQIPAELAKYGSTGVVLGALILVGWLVNKFLMAQGQQRDFATNAMKHMEEIHAEGQRAMAKAVDKVTTATNKNTKAIDKLTSVSTEQHNFLKNLNGRLSDVIVEKLDKQAKKAQE